MTKLQQNKSFYGDIVNESLERTADEALQEISSSAINSLLLETLVTSAERVARSEKTIRNHTTDATKKLIERRAELLATGRR